MIGFVVVVLLDLFWRNSVYDSYIEYSSVITQNYIDNAKQQIRSDVLKTIKSIEYKDIEGRYKIKDIIKSNLDRTIAIASQIYREIKDSYHNVELKTALMKIFNSGKFYFGKGVYLIVDRSGNIIGKPSVRFNGKTKERFTYFFSNFTNGFFDGKTENGRDFVSYVRFFKPLNVYVMAFMPISSFENSIKKEAVFSIVSKNTVVNKNRYIFINTTDGNCIIVNNEICSDGTKLWDVYESQKDKRRMVALFKKELEAYKSPLGGRFIRYKFYKPKTGKVEEKISYIYGYKPWKWIIGEGFYVHQISSTIKYAKMRFYDIINATIKHTYMFLSFTMVSLFIMVYVIYIVSKNRIEYILDRFDLYFNRRIKINRNKCKVDEICRIIDYINNILETFNRYENEFLEAFSYAMEVKDTYTKGHSHRVAKYSKLIGESLGLTNAKQEELYKMGLLHDIGKIGIPDNILLKPGKLSANEYKIVQYHSIFSYEIVSKVSQFQSMASNIRHHHERCDGSGYPDNLKCDNIELEAKILAIADVFDALTSRRTYRDKLSPQEAIEVLKAEQLDQDIIKRVEEILIEGYIEEENTEIKLSLTEEVDTIRRELFDTDYMTGLKRRRVFVRDVKKLIRKNRIFSMFMVDIKSLSLINYEFSTEIGDRIIVDTAAALSNILDELGYRHNNLSRAYNDAFLFTVSLKDENEIPKLVKLSDKIRDYLIYRVKSMVDEQYRTDFINKSGKFLGDFIDFHVVCCVYPYEASDVERMIYVCSSKKRLSLVNTHIDNIEKNSNIKP